MTMPYGEPVTLLREITDRTGDVTLVDEGVVEGCGWAPAIAPGERASVEQIALATSQVVTGRTLYLPPGNGLTASHRVRFVDGTVWEVVGELRQWRSPLTGWRPGDAVELRRVTG